MNRHVRFRSDDTTVSLSEVHRSVEIPESAGVVRKMFAFAGPAYLVSVGYMDPGNWATDLEGGARFGYQLVWVLLMSNLMAILLQTLSARMGIVTGRDLAQACREHYPKPVAFTLWILCEVAIAACDLAEVLGTAIGLNLLFKVPILYGVIITGFDTMLFLVIQQFGSRKMEAFILMLISTIGICFGIEVFLSRPVWPEVVAGFVPRLSSESLYVAIGILGATVMPHNLYLHSALVQTRDVGQTTQGKRTACKYNLIDTAFALNAAFLVNAAILLVSAAVFFRNGVIVTEIQKAYHKTHCHRTRDGGHCLAGRGGNLWLADSEPGCAEFAASICGSSVDPIYERKREDGRICKQDVGENSGMDLRRNHRRA